MSAWWGPALLPCGRWGRSPAPEPGGILQGRRDRCLERELPSPRLQAVSVGEFVVYVLSFGGSGSHHRRACAAVEWNSALGRALKDDLQWMCGVCGARGGQWVLFLSYGPDQ